MIREKTLFLGIGSPHGDDRIGWMIIDELAAHHVAAECRRAHTPSQLFDWLDGLQLLVLCDAVRSRQPVGTVRRWDWPAPEISGVRFQGTHDLSLPAALQLAALLDRLPPRVRIWGIEIGDVHEQATVSPELARSVPEIAREIYEDACDA